MKRADVRSPGERSVMADESRRWCLGSPARSLGPLCWVLFVLGCMPLPCARAQKSAVDPDRGRTSPPLSPDRIRAAAVRALPPLQKSLVVYAEKRDCFSCHNQAVPLVALEIARSRGLAIDEDAFQGAVALTLADLESALERLSTKDRASPAARPAPAMRSGRSRRAKHHAGSRSPPRWRNSCSEADRDRDHWTSSARRWPIEASHFTTTALTLARSAKLTPPASGRTS